jgi:alanyl-tRNA synthetase
LPVESSAESGTRRLVEIRGVDLALCGGTHVKTTGQIGNIQLRGCESTVEGTRIEFVCGARALRHARADFQALARPASLSAWEGGGEPPR